MDWDDLRYVLAVSREQSLSLAAARLGVAHTTVGRRVRAIEEALGVRLFDKTPDAFVPTEAGQDIAEVAERMEGEVLSLEGRVFGRDNQLEGKLRVTTMDLVFRGYHGAFASFVAKYPSIDMTLTFSDTHASLARREADIALRLTSSPPEQLVGRKVGRVDFAVYGRRELVEAAGPDAPLDAFPWLHWDEKLGMSWLDDWLAERAPEARIAMRMGGTSTDVREVVAAGIGVHFLAVFDGDNDPRLTRIGPVEKAYSRDVWLLTLPDLRHTGRIRAFMKHMESAFREEAKMT